MKSATGILLAALACVDKSAVALELEGFPKLPTVPEVLNPDKHGFPTMKSIQSVMEGFVRERDILNNDAAFLGLQLKKVEKEDAARVAQQREVYQKKLKEQEKKNQVVSVENAKVAKLVMQVRKGNDKLSALVQKEQKLIQWRRNQFAEIKKRFLEGQTRVNSLLKDEDEMPRKEDKPAEDETARNEFNLDQDETARKVDELDQPMSFLEMSLETVQIPSSPELIQASSVVEEVSAHGSKSAQTGLLQLESETSTQISDLASQAGKLSQAVARSLAELKESFQEGWKAGAKRNNALMQQQSALKASLKSAEEQFQKLKATYKRVTGVRQGLEQELQKNGVQINKDQQM